MAVILFRFQVMTRTLYNFLANYQWYFVGVFAYMFIRGYEIIKDILIGVQLMKIWFVASALITLYTQFYFYRHKEYKPQYQVPYIILFILVTMAIVEASQYSFSLINYY